MRTLSYRAAALATFALTIGCTDAVPTAIEPAGPAAARTSASAANCANVSADATMTLGQIPIAPGVVTVGALPVPVTLAGVSGMLSSIVTGLDASGKNGQGAQHITLIHNFISAQGTFSTTDRAVCGVAGTDPNVCRINDVLQVTSGTGVFENAGGSLRNHGVIDLNTYTLTLGLRGRVCGDGVSSTL